jgi:hypothetical protein
MVQLMESGGRAAVRFRSENSPLNRVGHMHHSFFVPAIAAVRRLILAIMAGDRHDAQAEQRKHFAMVDSAPQFDRLISYETATVNCP